MILLALAMLQAMSDTRAASGPFVRGEWRGDCVRGGDSPRAGNCRAVRKGPVTLTLVRNWHQLEVSARLAGCKAAPKPIVIPAEQLDGMRRAMVVGEALDRAAWVAIKTCRSKAKPPQWDGGALFNVLAATDGLVTPDE